MVQWVKDLALSLWCGRVQSLAQEIPHAVGEAKKKKKGGGRRPEQTFFSKDDMKIANRYTKRCSASLIISEMQIKTTMRYHLTSLRMAIIKKNTNNKCW